MSMALAAPPVPSTPPSRLAPAPPAPDHGVEQTVRSRTGVPEAALPRGGSRRQAIAEGAAEMFAQYGYYGASLRNIARHVGISHPGLIHHFATKSDLLDAVIDRLEESAQENLQWIEHLCAGPDTLTRSLTALYDPTSPQIRLLARLDSEIVDAEHPGRFRIARLRLVHEHVIHCCLDKLARSGRIRPDTDPAFAARTVISLVMAHASREATVGALQKNRHDDEPAEDLRRLVQLFLSAG